jgi:hypothetical protein
MGKLKNAKHELFCQEYLANELNATKAYQKVYNPKTGASASGARLLANVKITQRVEELKSKRSKKIEKSSDEFLDQLRFASLFDPAECYRWNGDSIELKHFDDIPIEARRMIQEIVPLKEGGCRVKFVSKEKMTELWGRHKGTFNDKLHIKAEVTLESLVDQSHGKDDE